MSYFSFSVTKSIIDESFISDNQELSILFNNIKYKNKYYSKYLPILKAFGKSACSKSIIFFNKEEIQKYISFNKDTIFFLPPKYGLGDIIEYGLAIKKIQKKFPKNKIGLAFVYKYKKILQDLLKLKNLYDYFISEKELLKYTSHFHFTHEINALKYQKYNREDIEKSILDKFNIEDDSKKLHYLKQTKKNIKKISIYPFSASPLRTLPLKSIVSIVKSFSGKFDLEIIMDNDSPYLKNYSTLYNILNIKLFFPQNVNELLEIIKETEFGIFIDSGPLHLAKVLEINGVLIENSVVSSKLIRSYLRIKTFKNDYRSLHCKGPCGLTNIFNYKNTYGCYENLKIGFEEIKNMENLKSLQRGDMINKYDFFIKNPVGCVKNINNKSLINFIKKNINKIGKEKF